MFCFFFVIVERSMEINLNEEFGNEFQLHDQFDEIDLYRLFEDVYRDNERVEDDVGIRERSWDMIGI